MSEFHDFLELWRDLYRVERKVVASEIGVSPTQYWRIESGKTPLSAERLRALARLSKSSFNTILLAFMLMDDNIERIDTDDPGDRLVLWLHERLAGEARRNETDSIARHFLGRPQSLQAVFDDLRQMNDAPLSDHNVTAGRYRSAVSG